MIIEPTIETINKDEQSLSHNLVEGATKMYRDKGDTIQNGNTTYVILSQNDEDTLLQKVEIQEQENTTPRLVYCDYYVVAWGLQKDGTWNQGHYYTNIEQAKKVFNQRFKHRVTESENFPQFLARASKNETAKKIVAIANKYKYRCRTPYITSWGEVKMPLTPLDHRFPDVRYDDDEKQFELNNWSHGSMSLKEYKELTANGMKAIEMCEKLQKLDFRTLEQELD